MLNEWAKAWGISDAALNDLKQRTCIDPSVENIKEPGASESRIQSQCRLRAGEQGNFLLRNNVGALQDKRGIPVRYGLMNDSSALNKVIKSADLIGGRQVLITPEMVGSVILQFYSVEVKEGAWRHNPNDAHEAAQVAWMNYINSRGGYAQFASSPEHI